MNTEEERRAFYSYPTGYGSNGGYDYLCGKPRALPWWWGEGMSPSIDTEDDAQSYYGGYDWAKRLWPTEESRAWFNP